MSVAPNVTALAIKIVLDKSESYSPFTILKAAGIEVRNNTNWKGIMHNKIAVIDYRIVLTGSFNWTTTAENNNNG